MKKPNLALVPTVVGFGKSDLEKRVISIMNFKKPTALTGALSAFLVIGIGSTAAFAVAPKTEDPAVVPNRDLTVTTSEPGSETDPADNDLKNGEPEPAGSKGGSANGELTDDDNAWSEPDENGISYNKSNDTIRVPVMDISLNSDLDYKANGFRIILGENKEKHFLTLQLDNLPNGYNHAIFLDEGYAIVKKCDFDLLEAENYTY